MSLLGQPLLLLEYPLLSPTPPLPSSCLQGLSQSQSHPLGAPFPLAGALMAPAPSVQNWESNTLIMTQIGAVSIPSPNVSTKIATEVRCAISHKQGFLSPRV